MKQGCLNNTFIFKFAFPLSLSWKRKDNVSLLKVLCWSCDWYILVYIERETDQKQTPACFISRPWTQWAFSLPWTFRPAWLSHLSFFIHSSQHPFFPFTASLAFSSRVAYTPKTHPSLWEPQGQSGCYSISGQAPFIIIFVFIYIICSRRSFGIADLNNGSYKFHQCRRLRIHIYITGNIIREISKPCRISRQ